MGCHFTINFQHKIAQIDDYEQTYQVATDFILQIRMGFTPKNKLVCLYTRVYLFRMVAVNSFHLIRRDMASLLNWRVT